MTPKKRTASEVLRDMALGREYDVSDSESFGGRLTSGLFQMPDTILRGIFRIGQGATQDTVTAGARALEGVNLTNEAISSKAERAPRTLPMAGAIWDSQKNTGRLLSEVGKAAVIPSQENREALQERGREFYEDPAFFGLEHIGNVALWGALANKPIQLGVAAQRGAMTPGQAARGLIPGPEGKAARVQGRVATEQAAAEGSRAAQFGLFAQDVVGHPYMSAVGGIARSTPVQLVRNPMARADAWARFTAPFRGERGEIIFKAEAPEGKWNQLYEELRWAQTDEAKEAVRIQMREVANDLAAKGIEADPVSPNRLDITVETDPSSIVARPNFQWDPDNPAMAGEFNASGQSFARIQVNNAQYTVERVNPDLLKPNVVNHVLEYGGTPERGGTVFATGPDGRVIGTIDIDPFAGINAGVLPDFQGQGFATKMVMEAMDAGLPVYEAALASSFSGHGTKLVNRILDLMGPGQGNDAALAQRMARVREQAEAARLAREADAQIAERTGVSARSHNTWGDLTDADLTTRRNRYRIELEDLEGRWWPELQDNARATFERNISEIDAEVARRANETTYRDTARQRQHDLNSVDRAITDLMQGVNVETPIDYSARRNFVKSREAFEGVPTEAIETSVERTLRQIDHLENNPPLNQDPTTVRMHERSINRAENELMFLEQELGRRNMQVGSEETSIAFGYGGHQYASPRHVEWLNRVNEHLFDDAGITVFDMDLLDLNWEAMFNDGLSPNAAGRVAVPDVSDSASMTMRSRYEMEVTSEDFTGFPEYFSEGTPSVTRPESLFQDMPVQPRHSAPLPEIRWNDNAWRLVDGTELSPTGLDSLPQSIREWRPPEGKRGFVHRSQIKFENDTWYDSLTNEAITEAQIHPIAIDDYVASVLGTPEGRASAVGASNLTDAPNLPGATRVAAESFQALADAQRGAPEEAMLAIQRQYSGGEAQWLAEHVGDLTNRMAKQRGPGDFGYGDVGSKIRGAKSTLDNPNHARFVRENLESNYRYAAERDPNIGSFDDYVLEFNARMQGYAEAHRQLPVYNQAQYDARAAAIAIGEQRWTDAKRHIDALDSLYQDRARWVAENSKFNPDFLPSNNPTRVSSAQLRDRGVEVFELARERPDFQQRVRGVADAVSSGEVDPGVSVRVRETSSGDLAFQLDDGTHRFFAAEQGLLPDDLTVNFVTDAQGTPATGRLLERARTEFQQGTPQQARSPQSDSPLDMLRDLARGEEGAIFPEGTGTSRFHGDGTVGPLDLMANEVGLAIIQARNSRVGQSIFAPDAMNARLIRKWLDQGIRTGSGPIGQQVAGRIGRLTGNQELRRRWDPSRVERLFLRDINNLRRRPDAPEYQNLIDDLQIDRLTPRNAPGRVGRIASGDRVIGQVTPPETLLRQVSRVIQEAQTRSRGNPEAFLTELEKIVPGADPMGTYLMGLNAAELAQGLPHNSLVSALGDFITMDRFSDLNRQAQAAMRNVDPSATPERFRLPDEALDININSQPKPVQEIFYGAAEQYRRDLARYREPELLRESVIGPSGTRAGISPDQPTRFDTSLEGRPLTPETRQGLTDAQQELGTRRAEVSKIEGVLDDLKLSGEPLRVRDPNTPLTYRNGRPTQASLDRAWKTTPTGEAIKRWQERLGQEREALVQASARLENLENAARYDPANAPSAARNLLTYAQEVAPRQAEILRRMARDGQGNPQVLEGLAKELDSIPRTLEELNSADVYLAYLRDVKVRSTAGTGGPGGVARPMTSTRAPGGAQRRDTGRNLDLQFERDFRTRAYWQDSEFQNWFMRRQADQMLRNQNVVRSGRNLLEEGGLTKADIDGMSPGQIQQWLEMRGYKSYNPEAIFNPSRKPQPPGRNPLDADWVSNNADAVLQKSIKNIQPWEKTLFEGIYDPAVNAWKVFVLPLRLAWQVNNFAGNAMLTMLAGKVSPRDYPMLARASARAVRNWNRGTVADIEVPLNAAYRAELTAKLNTLPPESGAASRIRGMLDDGVLRLPGDTVQEIANAGIARGDFAWLNNSQFLREVHTGNQNILRQFDIELPQMPGGVGRRFRNLKKTGREFVDYSYHLNETVDNFHRTMLHLDRMMKGSDPSQALAAVNKALGDYSKLNGFERRVLKRMYPFYPWMQHMVRVVANSLHPSNINRTVIFSHIMAILGEPNEMEELLPDYAGGHIYVGDAEDGTPKFLSTRGLNPFLDVFDPLSQPNMMGLLRPAAPPIQYMFEKTSGTSILTGRPFSSAPGSELDRPPASEYLFRNIPQAKVGRDIYRDLMGQPLTRYGTGEPAFFPGADDHTSGARSLAQYMGLNIRALDVENMHRQETVREYREEVQRRRHERQVERDGGRTARDLLPERLRPNQ